MRIIRSAAPRRRESGGALLAVLGFALLALLLLFATLQDTRDRVRFARFEADEARAYYAAETGFRLTLHVANKQDTIVTEADNPVNFQGQCQSRGGPQSAGSESLEDAPASSEDRVLSVLQLSPDGQDGFDGFRRFVSDNENNTGLRINSFADEQAVLGRLNEAGAIPDGQFRVRTRPLGNSNLIVRAIGVFGGHARSIQAVLRPQFSTSAGAGGFGIVAGHRLKVNGNAYFVDSYRSDDPGGSPPGYNPSLKQVVINGVPLEDQNGDPILRSYANGNVSIGSNNSIDINHPTPVTGQIVVGASGSLSGVFSGALVPPAQLPQDIPQDIPVFTLPSSNNNGDLAASGAQYDGSNYNLQGRNVATLGAAGQSRVYRVETFALQGRSTLNIAGDVTLYATQRFSQTGRTIINILPGGRLLVRATKNVVVAGNGVINQTGLPSNLRFEVNPQVLDPSQGFGSVQFEIQGTADFIGLVQAPFSQVKIQGNADFYGSVSGYEVEVQGNSKFHFDETVQGSTSEEAVPKTYAIVSFIELR